MKDHTVERGENRITMSRGGLKVALPMTTNTVETLGDGKCVATKDSGTILEYRG